MTTITATATRSGRWWAVEFTNSAGQRFTQARRLDQIPETVADICAMDDVKVDHVDVTPVTQRDAQVAVEQYREATKAAAEAAERASQASRHAARLLHDAGLSMRDVGAVMGLSHQRASQLIDA
nr:MAG TPA: antitoxin [Caudoviricetes sp.]